MDLPPPAPQKLETPYIIVAQELPNAAPAPSPEFYRAMGNSGGGRGGEGGGPVVPTQNEAEQP